MQARTAIGRPARTAGRTAVGWGLMTVLAVVALSACSLSGSSSTPGSPSASLFSGSATGSATRSSTAASTSTATGSTTSSASTPPTTSTSAPPTSSATSTPSRTPSPTPAQSPPSTPYPSAAPQTGGGGTAGFQDTGLLALGGAAIVAGFGSIAYRRKLTRKR